MTGHRLAPQPGGQRSQERRDRVGIPDHSLHYIALCVALRSAAPAAEAAVLPAAVVRMDYSAVHRDLGRQMAAEDFLGAARD